MRITVAIQAMLFALVPLAASAESPQALRVVVHIHDYAHAAPQAITSAQRFVSDVYAEAGVIVTWPPRSPTLHAAGGMVCSVDHIASGAGIAMLRAGGSAVNISWNEYLNRPAQASSEYRISGDFEAADLVRLGYTIARYAEGRLGVTVSGAGRGFDIDNAEIELDLRGAAVESPWHFWTKNAGVAATAWYSPTRIA